MRTPKPGQHIDYRAFAGDVYRAVVICLRAERDLVGTFVDIDVIIPGCGERLTLTAVRWNDEQLFPYAGWPERKR